MLQRMLSDAEIKDLLERARTIAVVGLSDRPERESHGIAGFLLRQGYRVLPVNPNLRGPVLGQSPYASLREIAEPVDIVNVFRRSEYVARVVEDAIAIWSMSLDGSTDGAEDAAHLVAQEDEGDDRNDRDECKDQGVLRQTLTFGVALERCLHSTQKCHV